MYFAKRTGIYTALKDKMVNFGDENGIEVYAPALWMQSFSYLALRVGLMQGMFTNNQHGAHFVENETKAANEKAQ